MTFKQAVERTPHMQNAWRPGLSALRKRDRTRVEAEHTRSLRGSADVDAALRHAEPNARRWDFAIGYQHSNRAAEFIYWVETHTGSDAQIAVVLDKLEWLKNWMRHGGRELARFEREFVWVASGPTSFTRGATQVKTLATRGLRYVSVLRILSEYGQVPAR